MVGHPAIWDSARVLNIKALLNMHDKFECQPRDQQELPVPPSELCCPLSARKLMLKVTSPPACRLASAVPTQHPLAWRTAKQDCCMLNSAA